LTQITDHFGDPLGLGAQQAALRQSLITDLNVLFSKTSVEPEAAALLNSLTFLSGARQTDFSQKFSQGFSQGFSQTPSVFSNLVGLPEKAAAFTTVSQSGQRIDNDDSSSTPNVRKWLRTDGKADGRKATTVTFAYNNFQLNGISTLQAKMLFATALQTWANHSPLDFVEVADPGAGDLVDIYVTAESIDGVSGTLAYAFFPENGDITFDADENWTANRFLETAVHEIGHSLGLDHEDDTDAIMNSTLRNRFSSGSAFLLEDDINGIRSLYGSGEGSVTTLDIHTQPIALAPAPNLVINGSFEDIPLDIGEYGMYKRIVGWSTISGIGLQVDKRAAIAGAAAEGSAWVELDIYRQNSTIGQNIDTLTGQTYQLSVDFSNGGRPDSTTAVEVFWEGKKLDTLTGGGKGEWLTFDYEVIGGDRSVSTLAFRAIGPSDSVGGFIDNIIVTEVIPLELAEAQQPIGTTGEPTMHRDPLSSELTDSTVAGLPSNHFLTGSTFNNFS